MKRSSSFLLPGLLLGAGSLIACSGDRPSPDAPEIIGPPDWVVEVVSEPARFAGLLEETGREGWVAVHANDHQRAEAAFTGDDAATQRARARAGWSMALFYDDLARATDHALYAFLASWNARELEVTPGVQTLATQWRSCDGLEHLGLGDDAAKLPAIFHAEGGDPATLAARKELHDQARAGDLTALQAQAARPLIVEAAEGFERTFYDPCLYRTLSTAWWDRAAATTGGEGWAGVATSWAESEGLEPLLFAPWLTQGDLQEELTTVTHPGLIGATQPSLAILGVPRETSEQDDVEVARDDVRALDAALDARRESMVAHASDDGIALLGDLGLQQRFRQEWITTRARKSLLENRPHQALAYLELARDVSRREVGPSNTPSVLALYAEAEIRLGRTREALDVLTVLEHAHPEVVGLKELASDLAVLQGMDRQGDSKEN